jgi:hypothetical protein
MCIGLLSPIVAFLSTSQFESNLRLLGKDDILYVISAAINLLLLRYYFKTERDNTGNGIFLSTFLCVFIFFFFLKFRQ